LEWIKKPWALGKLIEYAVVDKVKLTEKIARDWFPRRINEWLAV